MLSKSLKPCALPRAFDARGKVFGGSHFTGWPVNGEVWRALNVNMPSPPGTCSGQAHKALKHGPIALAVAGFELELWWQLQCLDYEDPTDLYILVSLMLGIVLTNIQC